MMAAGAQIRSTYTNHQTRFLCPNKQQISFSLVHPLLNERLVEQICRRFGMSARIFKAFYEETAAKEVLGYRRGGSLAVAPPRPAPTIETDCS